MAAESVTIKAIDATAVHKIQSGQVIVNLCSVAKELVENSIDAGATSIEVRFKNQGLDAVEVQDNGYGVSPQNYEGLALKHYTSKLSSYDDLDTLQTFGFRGEALSSLCALSSFSVVTCQAADVPKGTRLDFDISGRLKGTAVVAAQKGTTVTVEKLFGTLPVRRRELERNIKREWGKVISLLNQYACIQTGVKFTVSQQPNKGKRVVLFSTKGNASTRDNIINIFGAKTMTALIRLGLTMELELTRDARAKRSAPAPGDVGDGGNVKEIRVEGYVSRPAHGQGRQTPDRQMFFVNGRPCKLPQFAQLFGEVYRTYNTSQAPFIFADIQLDTHLYDVNVSPDKQTILLHDQGRMLDTLRESLIELFEKQEITMPMSQLSSQKITAFRKPPASQASSPSSATPVAGKASIIDDTTSQESTGHAQRESEEPGHTADGGQEKQPMATAPDPSPVDEDSKEEHLAGGGEDEEIDKTTRPAPSPPRPSQAEDDEPIVFAIGPRKRGPPRYARVTVGNTTVSTSVISSSKRLKMGGSSALQRPMSTETTLRRTRAKKVLPSFGGTLTQMFSAVGGSRKSGNADVASEGEEEEEEEGDEDEDEGVEDEDEEDAEAGVEDDGEEEGDDEEGEEEEDEGEQEGEEEEEEEEEGAEREGEDEKMEEEAHVVMEEDDEDQMEGVEPDGTSQSGADRPDDVVEDDDDQEDDASRRDNDTAEVPETEEDRRSRLFLKSSGSKKRHETLRLVQTVRASEAAIERMAMSGQRWQSQTRRSGGRDDNSSSDSSLEDGSAAAEEKLALTIAKSDFAQMRVVGQFNLGFILAVRRRKGTAGREEGGQHEEHEEHKELTERSPRPSDDELFIIDQHASDEKYNFERLQATTVVQSQRLVRPLRLALTAVEEEIVLESQAALAANGFVVEATVDGSEPVGGRCRLLTLPLSRETTFDLTDLEELIALLGEHGGERGAACDGDDGDGRDDDDADYVSTTGSAPRRRPAPSAIPRPGKVRRMLAMRACRSSIMVGRALTRRQMAGVLAHMGEMDKPWNCPHGRPTMRHLSSLGRTWDGGHGWREEDDAAAARQQGDPSGWAAFLKKKRRTRTAT